MNSNLLLGLRAKMIYDFSTFSSNRWMIFLFLYLFYPINEILRLLWKASYKFNVNWQVFLIEFNFLLIDWEKIILIVILKYLMSRIWLKVILNK